MTKQDWKRLDELFDISFEDMPLELILERKKLFELTEREQEHPEWYDQPCYCYECKCAGI